MNREVTLVYGKTGMGKSSWVKRHVRPLPRVIIMDPKMEYPARHFDDLGQLIAHVDKPAFRVSVSNVSYFPLLCEVATAARRVWLVIEEAQRVMPAGMPVPDEFLDIIYRGREPQVSVLMVSQRPTTVNIAARSQWDRIVCFNQTEPADVRWIQTVSGFDMDPRTLGRGEYFVITAEDVQRRKIDLPPRPMRESQRFGAIV